MKYILSLALILLFAGGLFLLPNPTLSESSAAPQIDTLSPNPSSAGEFVTIEGSNFTLENNVRVGDVILGNLSSSDGATLVFKVPNLSEASHDVRVGNENGQSNITSLTITSQSATTASPYTCTLVIGFSQTRQWYADVPNFESKVEDDKWELLWNWGGGVEKWSNPNYRGWSNDLVSPCIVNSNDPDRVLLTISNQDSDPDPNVWAGWIEDALATIRSKYPNVEQIILQPVIGGPNEEICLVDGTEVRASVNHPTIDQAIALVVGGDVVAGMSPEVRACEDYTDSVGHIRGSAKKAMGDSIGDYYITFDTAL